MCATFQRHQIKVVSDLFKEFGCCAGMGSGGAESMDAKLAKDAAWLAEDGKAQ